jgi:hypothetical protein
MKLPECWYRADSEEEARLTKELQLEMIPGHQLYGKDVKVIAHRDGANDDILCAHADENNLFMVVHLTWSMKPEIDDKHPSIFFQGSYKEFLKWEETQL